MVTVAWETPHPPGPSQELCHSVPMGRRRADADVPMWKPEPPGPQNGTVFGDTAFREKPLCTCDNYAALGAPLSGLRSDLSGRTIQVLKKSDEKQRRKVSIFCEMKKVPQVGSGAGRRLWLLNVTELLRNGKDGKFCCCCFFFFLPQLKI